MKTGVIRVLKQHLSLLTFLLLMVVFRSAVADWNVVPTGSMKPTIVEGDRILVNKMAYDLRVPFTHVSLRKFDDPQRGDIVIFDSKVSGKRLVKRVIGLPGDSIEMHDNILKINGKALRYKPVEANLRNEDLLGTGHFVQTRKSGSRLSSFYPVTVPDEHYFVMGDNRDNSADSRVIGFVPRHEVVGRSKTVVMSLNYDNHYLPRMDRFLRTL